MKLEYKFVELSIVTDETIEEAVNAWVSRGWLFEGIRFVTNEASRRPQMAFISFTRELVLDAADDKSDKEMPEVVERQTRPKLTGPRLVKPSEPDAD